MPPKSLAPPRAPEGSAAVAAAAAAASAATAAAGGAHSATPATAVLWPEEAATENSLCLLDLQGEALVALQELPAATATLLPLEKQQQQQQHDQQPNELWGLLRWPTAAAAAAGSSSNSSCTLQVGGDCLQGKIKPFTSGAGPGALAVLRKVKRPLKIDTAGCTYAPEPATVAAGATAAAAAAAAGDNATAAVPAWELQGTVESTIAFCEAPILDPFQEEYAAAAAGHAPAAAQHGTGATATAATAAETVATTAAAATETAEKNAVWLVAPSPQLPHLEGAWQLLQLDSVLRDELQRQQREQQQQQHRMLLLLKGRPAALPQPETGAQMWAEGETLLCSRSSSFVIARNEIDGEILICCRAAAAADEDGMALDQNSSSSSGSRNGVTVMGICRSVLQLEKVRGRIYQVQQLLQQPLPRLLQVRPGAMPAAAAGRAVLPLPVLLRETQAAPTETAAVLLGDHRLACLDPPARATSPPASQQQQQQETVQQQVQQLLRQLPPLWGTTPHPPPQSALYDTETRGYFSLSTAVLRCWVLRIADYLALASSSTSSSEWFTVGWALEAVRECVDKRGLQILGLRVHPAAAAAAADSDVEEEEGPVLTAGLLLQLLRHFCDIRLPGLRCSSSPTALGDSCPPLEGEPAAATSAAAAAAAAAAADAGDLVDVLQRLEQVLNEEAAAAAATAAVNPLKLHLLLAGEAAAKGGLLLQLHHGVAFTAAAPVAAADTKAFCLALGRSWRQLPLRILQWGETHLNSRVAALRFFAAAALQQQQQQVGELLLAAAEHIPLLAMWFHWQLLRGGGSTLSAAAALRCCTYGFPELRTDFLQEQEQQGPAAAKCLLYPKRNQQGDTAAREAAEAAARLMRAAAVALVDPSGSSSSTTSSEFALLLPEAADRRAFLQGMLLSPLRGSFTAVEGQMLLLPLLLLPMTLRERLAAAFAVKTIWREEELQPLLRDCQCKYNEEQDLAVQLGGPPAAYCYVQQTQISTETNEQVTSFRARNVPIPYWDLD